MWRDVISANNMLYRWFLRNFINVIELLKLAQNKSLNISIFSLTIFKGIRSRHQKCSMKKGVLGNLTKFIGKHLCQSLFFNEVAGNRQQKTSARLLLELWDTLFTSWFKVKYSISFLSTSAKPKISLFLYWFLMPAKGDFFILVLFS